MEYKEAVEPVEMGSEETAPKKPRKRFFDAKSIAYFGILTALEIVLLLWGSAVPVGAGGASLNFSLVPIVLGAILMGPVAGALLGLISGIAIFIMVILGAQGPVFSYLFAAQPVMIALICLVKTTAAGLVSGILYRLVAKKNQKAAVFAAAVAAPIVNTGLFVLGMLCISGAVMPLHTFLSNVVLSCGRSGVNLWCTCGLGLASIVLMVCIWPLGIRSMVVGYTALNLLWVLVWHFFVRRLTGYGFVMFMRDTLPFAFAAMAVMAATYFATAWIGNMAVLLVARIAVAAVLYYAVMRVARVHILNECQQFIVNKLFKRKH